MNGLPPLVQAEFERLMATPPAFTTDLSVSVRDVLAVTKSAKNPDDYKLCAEGVTKSLRKLKVKKSEGDVVITLPRALAAGVSLADLIRTIDACHPDSNKVLRLFAADCADMVLPLFEHHYPSDDRPRKAIEAARVFALGVVTAEQLAAARAAADAADAARAADADADAAARDAAWAARDAAWDAARDAAWAARDAAWAARDAAWDAAWDAARHAAWAARHAAWAARDAAWDAARDAAWDAAWDASRQLLSRYHTRKGGES